MFDVSASRVVNKRLQLCHVTLLFAVLLAGVVFYATYRTAKPPWFLYEFVLLNNYFDLASWVIMPLVPQWFLASAPSLLCGLAVVFFVALLTPKTRSSGFVAIAICVGTLLLLEVCIGFFSWLDIFATLAGVFVALLTLQVTKQLAGDSRKGSLAFQATSQPTVDAGEPARVSASRSVTVFPGVIASAFASMLVLGSSWDNGNFSSECARYSEEGYCEEYKQAASPVYMSYGALRAAFDIEAARPPDRIGRLYLYEDLVLLNEVNEGIHIIDNSDPTAPVNKAFIRLPGNTEIAVRSNYLYADSYVDLVTLDIADPENIVLIGREQDIFPFDEYQNIPQNITFGRTGVDRDLGVVVSYRVAGS